MPKKEPTPLELAMCRQLVANAAATNCPNCGGTGFFDNRDIKKGKAPDFKCKNKACDTGSGYPYSVWLPADFATPVPSAQNAPARPQESSAPPPMRQRGHWPKAPFPMVARAYENAAAEVVVILAKLPTLAAKAVENDGQAIVTLIAGMVIRYHDMGGADYERDAWWNKVKNAADAAPTPAPKPATKPVPLPTSGDGEGGYDDDSDLPF